MNDITNTKENTAPKEKRKAVLSLENLDIRDYFAAKAMQGYVSYMGCEAEATDRLGAPNREVIARNAYSYADAMIAEREKNNE